MVDKLRRLCKEQGKSLFSLEQECGSGNGSINKWDRSSLSVAKVRAVADALSVSVSYLIGEQEKKPTPTDGDGLNETQRQIMEYVGQMSAREQEAFLLGYKHRKALVERIHLLGQGQTLNQLQDFSFSIRRVDPFHPLVSWVCICA